jgi:hypothetical protein
MLLAVMAALVAAAWLWRQAGDRSRSRENAPATRAPDPHHGGSEPARPTRPLVRPTPQLAGATAATGAAPAHGSQTFEQEPRDAAWAVEQEREMTLRLGRVVDELARGGIPIDVDPVECRRTLCKVGIHARDAAALGKLDGLLETPTGVLGWADVLVLSPVETASDGEVATEVTASFDRD